MPTFKERLRTVEAVQYTNNLKEVSDFIGDKYELMEGGVGFANTLRIYPRGILCRVGAIAMSKGSWIVKSDTGNLFPCGDEEFKHKYEPIK